MIADVVPPELVYQRDGQWYCATPYREQGPYDTEREAEQIGAAS